MNNIIQYYSFVSLLPAPRRSPLPATEHAPGLILHAWENERNTFADVLARFADLQGQWRCGPRCVLPLPHAGAEGLLVARALPVHARRRSAPPSAPLAPETNLTSDRRETSRNKPESPRNRMTFSYMCQQMCQTFSAI